MLFGILIFIAYLYLFSNTNQKEPLRESIEVLKIASFQQRPDFTDIKPAFEITTPCEITLACSPQGINDQSTNQYRIKLTVQEYPSKEFFFNECWEKKYAQGDHITLKIYKDSKDQIVDYEYNSNLQQI